jgi:DNA-binding protein HU-beta
MTKAELIEQIVQTTHIERPAATAIVEGVMESIRQSLIKGENVYLRGFGTFFLKKRAAKIGRNITKGTSIKIPATLIPAFRSGIELTEKVAKQVKVK